MSWLLAVPSLQEGGSSFSGDGSQLGSTQFEKHHVKSGCCTNYRAEEVLQIAVIVLERKKWKARSLSEKKKKSRVLISSYCLLADNLNGCVRTEQYMAGVVLHFEHSL